MSQPGSSADEFWAAWKALPRPVRREVASAAYGGQRAGEPITGAWIREYARRRLDRYWTSGVSYLPVLMILVMSIDDVYEDASSEWWRLPAAAGLTFLVSRVQRRRLRTAIDENGPRGWHESSS